MAKLYGSLVGLASQATAQTFVDNFCRDGEDAVRQRDKIALPVGQPVGDVISIGFFRPVERFNPLAQFWNDALGAGVTVSIGDVNFPAALAPAFSVAAAAAGPLWKAFTPSKLGLPLWQMLGYNADPGGMIELLATLGGANVGTAGALAWQITGHT